MKKFLTIFVIPILSLLIILFEVPAVERWLDKIGGDQTPFYVMIIIVVCVLLFHFFTVISPLKKLEKIEQSKWILVDELADKFINDHSFKRYKLAANVMIVEMPIFNKQEPHPKNPDKTKLSFFCPMFKFIWSFNGKLIDKRVKLTINQGSSGIAHKRGDIVIKHTKLENCDDFNLNKEQKSAISDLELIISCPIFAFDKKYNRFSTEKIIGVLNVSSNLPISKTLIKNEEARHILCEKVWQFSKICSYIM